MRAIVEPCVEMGLDVVCVEQYTWLAAEIRLLAVVADVDGPFRSREHEDLRLAKLIEAHTRNQTWLFLLVQVN